MMKERMLMCGKNPRKIPLHIISVKAHIAYTGQEAKQAARAWPEAVWITSHKQVSPCVPGCPQSMSGRA